MKQRHETRERYNDIPYDWDERYLDRDELPSKGMSKKQLRKYASLKGINKHQYR